MIVKEVLSRHIQMSWKFARSFIWSNHDSPPNLSSCNSSMWAQLQILVCGQIFSLWSNYILYCFNWAKNLPGHASTYINIFHQVLTQFVNPISLCIFFQVSVQNEAIWGKCYFSYSKWPETFRESSYLQIIRPWPISAQLSSLCESIIQIPYSDH